MLALLKITLLGKFSVVWGNEKVDGVQARKVDELLGYLLLFRNHPQSRETLAEILWEDQPLIKSKKNLRQTLSCLQCALHQGCPDSWGLKLNVESDWVQIDSNMDFSLDVAEFEKSYELVIGKQARELTSDDFAIIQDALALYKGDLLEGWHQDWCVLERERFQTMYLALLDKLVQYCEVHQNYDLGMAYATEILRHDRACERAHRQLMRLHYMAGDRTQALHQYDRCKSALDGELGVEPSQRTMDLYQQIRSDTYQPPLFIAKQPAEHSSEIYSAFSDIVGRLEEFSEMLTKIERHVQEEMGALENAHIILKNA